LLKRILPFLELAGGILALASLVLPWWHLEASGAWPPARPFSTLDVSYGVSLVEMFKHPDFIYPFVVEYVPYDPLVKVFVAVTLVLLASGGVLSIIGALARSKLLATLGGAATAAAPLVFIATFSIVANENGPLLLGGSFDSGLSVAWSASYGLLIALLAGALCVVGAVATAAGPSD